MRIDGTLAKWNDDRGFGFITPNQGGPEIFAHGLKGSALNIFDRSISMLTSLIGAQLLFEQALLAEGGQLDDPASFVRRLNGLLAMLPG